MAGRAVAHRREPGEVAGHDTVENLERRPRGKNGAAPVYIGRCRTGTRMSARQREALHRAARRGAEAAGGVRAAAVHVVPRVRIARAFDDRVLGALHAHEAAVP